MTDFKQIAEGLQSWLEAERNRYKYEQAGPDKLYSGDDVSVHFAKLDLALSALLAAERLRDENAKLKTTAGCLERALEAERAKPPTIYWQAVYDANLARAEQAEAARDALREAVRSYFSAFDSVGPVADASARFLDAEADLRALLGPV